MANTTLGKAKVGKKDEWYTNYDDIQTELNHYVKHFENKVVLCNCDDPFESNFCKFFLKNFNYLKLKRLICTSYSGSPFVGTQLSLFDDFDEPLTPTYGYVIDIKEVPMKNGRGVSDDDIDDLLHSKKRGVKKLKGNGDFRSKECIQYLEQADIVVTNPPFSLFREYIAQLIAYDKKFIIIGRMSALHYKEVFSLIQTNKIWTGYGFNLSLVYKTPYKNTEDANKKFVRSKGFDPDDGYVKVPGICWYTNIDTTKRHENLIIYKKYSPDFYPKYHNFDAINVDKISEIPSDYKGVIGVPDTILNVYNPDQFEIVGRSGDTDWVLNECDFFTPPPEDVIKKYKKINNTWRVQNAYLVDDKQIPIIVYSRIFIKRKEEIK